MRFDAKNDLSQKIKGERLIFPRRFCESLSGYSAACLLGVSLLSFATLAHAANNDSIDPASLVAPPAPSPIERIEKNLREAGQRAFDAAADVTNTALSLLGVNYKFGGNSPDTGLDCSGFVRYVFLQSAGISLPRSSKDQAKVGKVVDKSQLEPGDLVFFNTRRFQFSHVGVYLGDNKFVHSPSRGGSVEVVNLGDRYWQKAYNGARRIVGVVASAEANATTRRDTAKTEVASRSSQRETTSTNAARDQVSTVAATQVVAKPLPASENTSSPFTRDY